MKFKVHMVLFWDEEGFSTVCGINDGCSRAFYDCTSNLASFGNTNDTTCKRCLAKYKKMVTAHDKLLEELHTSI